MPYVHSKRQDRVPPRAGKYGDGSNGVNAGAGSNSDARVKVIAVQPEQPTPAEGQDLTPLGFLLGVMKDSGAPPHLRIKVARIVAPYVHPKRGRSLPIERDLVVDDQYGFIVDRAEAKALLDDGKELERLPTTWHQNKRPGGCGEQRGEILARIADRTKSLQCPPGYGWEDQAKDNERLFKLKAKREPDLKLTDEEEIEEAHLTTRIASHKNSPEAHERERLMTRLKELVSKSGKAQLSADEQEEMENLMTVDTDSYGLANSIMRFRINMYKKRFSVP